MIKSKPRSEHSKSVFGSKDWLEPSLYDWIPASLTILNKFSNIGNIPATSIEESIPLKNDKIISIKVIDTTDRGYNASITPGSQYDLFTATPTNITSKSSFSTFFELAQADFKHGEEEDTETIRKLYDDSYRVIKTGGYVLPENTTITMIDRTINGSPK